MDAVLSISKEKTSKGVQCTCLNQVRQDYMHSISLHACAYGYNHRLVLPLKRKVICYQLELGKNLANVLTERQQVLPDW